MRILAIETSADETGVALLEITGNLEKPEVKILGNSLSSQVSLHEEFGGIYPSLAKREHQKNLPILLKETLEKAGENEGSPNLDFIAVTTGPGLEPALWTGITFAKDLGEKWCKPILPINHMEGHIFSALFSSDKPLELPALALLVSGGHTELVHVKNFGQYEIIGRTLDDAVGEAYDKVARMLGLSYPGGPKISRLAEISREKHKEISLKFPRPMINSGDLNFSYSGLKTAVLYKLKSENRTDEEFKEDVSRAFEDAAIEVLILKTKQALEDLSDIKTLIIGGGVSANSHLQKEIEKLKADFPDLTILIPEKLLTTDNAIMIGIAGFIQATLYPEKLSTDNLLKANGNLSLTSSQS
jgi:N6-L-threonylcarbamoyladenine synthase